MTRADLLKLVERLAFELKTRNKRNVFDPHIQKLRLYYLAVKHGLDAGPERRVDLNWNAEMTEDLMKILRIPPYENAYETKLQGEGCPCDSKSRGLFTIVSLPGVTKMGCHGCGKEWLELEEK